MGICVTIGWDLVEVFIKFLTCGQCKVSDDGCPTHILPLSEDIV